MISRGASNSAKSWFLILRGFGFVSFFHLGGGPVGSSSWTFGEVEREEREAVEEDEEAEDEVEERAVEEEEEEKEDDEEEGEEEEEGGEEEEEWEGSEKGEGGGGGSLAGSTSSIGSSPRLRSRGAKVLTIVSPATQVEAGKGGAGVAIFLFFVRAMRSLPWRGSASPKGEWGSFEPLFSQESLTSSGKAAP